ncbi:uncharacterized protein LOC131801128 [Musca domestica]|uniref:Uncharacterized protein LOC131801128 n=1 Tax=Musca domestica TaxID=7370 RepID=A0ABM3UP02_MUSDO|nr:uncharacterized protein LOC131801128 [Musca domestica]
MILKIFFVCTLMAITFMSMSESASLGKLNVFVDGSSREETISLDDDKNLVIKGHQTQRWPQWSSGKEIVLHIQYKGNTDGYRASYNLTQTPLSLFLPVQVLKSLVR